MNISSQRSVPYPDTDGIIRNPAFINDVANMRISELGDVSDYIYFSLMLECDHPNLSGLFEKMAMTEMRHFGLLGKAIIAMGGDPAVRVRHTNPFYGRPDKLDGHTIKRILSGTLEREQIAMNSYLRLAASFSCDKAAAALFERIAADEEHHARMISRAMGDM